MNLPYHFVLVDVNEYYYNCGHYPEWVVSKVNAPLPAVVAVKNRGGWMRVAFATRQDAQDEADRLNTLSSRRWREFLSC